ncbi:uncharacterized protein LOC116346319 [Contarinia nasturtii]|uniref:uncharacterized protein LOC116346319 n=1 Tax=Contarinia nasturtii TaxID=265458 RepID=UPI0012D4BB32|nr:uncharacterized protein LOC116346319 [Contarinia nasturtii]XP_031632154.1 uncharacterized protein LOC116346319 [Contarinia nasturtii]
MGNNATKTSTTVLKIDTDGNEINMMQNILIDPRSPDVNRTPLVSILGMKSIEQTPTTRKTSLNTSNERKLLDPRSPSKFIPRTPLATSLDGTGIENSIGKYSLEYSGYIEEASCRNFNERLANITFDDSYTEANDASKIAAIKTNETINLSISHAADAIYDNDDGVNEQLRSTESMKRCQNTPMALPSEPTSRFDVNVYTDVENISPVINTTQHNKLNTLSAFSSTPISILNNQQKSMSAKKLATTNKDICIDNGTPGKRMVKTKEPRTPFGCLQNQQLIQKDHENSTPKSKTSVISKRTKKTRIINQIICD